MKYSNNNKSDHKLRQNVGKVISGVIRNSLNPQNSDGIGRAISQALHEILSDTWTHVWEVVNAFGKRSPKERSGNLWRSSRQMDMSFYCSTVSLMTINICIALNNSLDSYSAMSLKRLEYLIVLTVYMKDWLNRLLFDRCLEARKCFISALFWHY